MARPPRNNVDYFPFICKYGKTMRYIEKKYGNDGYATWIKILRELAVTDFHYLNLSEKSSLMDLSTICLVSEEILLNIINDLCTFGQFNTQLWNENKIIFSEPFIHNIQDAYKKRNNKCITLQGLGVLLCDLGFRKLYKGDLKGSGNPHSIVEYSIVKNTIYPSGNKIHQFLKDFENSESLTTISDMIDVPLEKLKAKIPEFKVGARPNYRNMNDLAAHFKFWYQKNFMDQKVNETPTSTSLVFGQNKHARK